MQFNLIPIDLRTPGQFIEFDNSRALQGLAGMPHKILVIGQRLAAGSVAAGVPTQITKGEQGEVYFGRGSMLSHMLAAFKAANPYTDCWAVALDDDGAAVAATGKLSVTSPATAAGTLYVYVGGRRVKVGIAAADTATDIAAAIVAAINADTSLPVTAAVNGVNDFEADLTARNKGEAGNSIDLRVGYYQGEQIPAGVAVTVTAMAGGTTNPDVADAITAIGGTQYNTVVMPYTDAANLTALETELADRWGPLVMREGHAFAAATGTHASLITLGSGRNSPHVTILGAGKSPTPPWEWAAVVAAVDAFEPDPARPRQTLTLRGVLPPAEPDLFTRAERELLLKDGVATATALNGTAYVERLITTYQTNSQGIEDTSYLDVTTMRTLAYLRYTVRAMVALKYPRHKLAADGTLFAPGQAVVTPSVIRAELCALFRQWEAAGLVEGFEQFKTDLLVERDAGDPNRLNALIPPDVINQLRVFAGQVQFRL